MRNWRDLLGVGAPEIAPVIRVVGVGAAAAALALGASFTTVIGGVSDENTVMAN